MRYDHVIRVKMNDVTNVLFGTFLHMHRYLFALSFIYLDCYSNNDVNKERKRKDSNQYDELLIVLILALIIGCFLVKEIKKNSRKSFHLNLTIMFI